jgi:DNA-directed RNA polymerase subunit omega
MAERRDTMMTPQIEELLSKVDSKFTLVTLAAKRGRQINSYFQGLGEGLGSLIPPQVTSLSRKPLTIALEEVAADKIRYERIDPATLAADGAEAEAEAAPEAE